MSSFKSVLACAASLAVVFAGTAANAESVRAGSSFPGVVSVKHAKLARTAAPDTRGSHAVIGTFDTEDLALAFAASVAGGVGFYYITRSDGKFNVNDSTGG